MPFFGKWSTALLSALVLAAASGCSPMDSSPQDEEKEPHFVLGKSRVNAMDYDGAIRAFEESLEANPHSAQAHFQLAMLYENQESDPAAAIYHYQEYLKYDPKADNAEVVQQHIASCKQQLAADVLQLPSAPAAQRQLEKLADENRRLRDQLAQWQAFYTALQAARTNQLLQLQQAQVQAQAQAQAMPQGPVPQVADTPATPAGNRTSTPVSRPVAAPETPRTTRATASRTHVVERGETLAAIARKHGVSLVSLEQANPSVNPRKLRAGQVINLPAP